jgi:putative acetyltransferase
MIRSLKTDELETVMKIWLETNLVAHGFINEDYWKGNYESVKNMLPDATVFVSEENRAILGFIGLIGTYVAGIFVEANSQSKGIGKALLDYVKKSSPELSLQVYKRNPRAINFYRREGFFVSNEQTDEATGETEYGMKWVKGDSK